MSFNIFYSWQSQQDQTYCKRFIEKCLHAAVKEIKKELKENSPDMYIDRDTKGVPGRPGIVETIETKIRNCDVFVADFTYMGHIGDLGIPSPNVIEELGMATGALRGSERIIAVINTAYGDPTQLHFDSLQKRWPISYKYDEHTTPEELIAVKASLTSELKSAIKLILLKQHERQKEHFHPFMTWRTWETGFDKRFNFETTEYTAEIFSEILSNIGKSHIVYRLCGLPGIGKTRMLFECFSPSSGVSPELAGQILYVDANEAEEAAILRTARELLSQDDKKILIVDNCSSELHISIAPLISKDKSELRLISVSSNPDETVRHLEPDKTTRLLKIDNTKCGPIVDQILTNNFKEFAEDERKLLAEFASGIPLIATIMAGNTERGVSLPGSLTRNEIVQRLLGPLYDDELSRAAVVACSLFSRFGYLDEYAHQSERIALDRDLFSIVNPIVPAIDEDEYRKNLFGEICQQLHARQLLEKRGRTYSFRPSPLAIRMAEEWWRSCTSTKFKRVLPMLEQANLVEPFCEQFRYLKHVENAKLIVAALCDSFFNQAEVLNSEVGSRLFRSFVYVNPLACANAISNAILPLQREYLFTLEEGRRNLVWALEQLCFRKTTFRESAEALAALSVAENENIANNATNQFKQLFHIYLSGTEVTLMERWAIVDYCFSKDAYYQALGLEAINHALTSENFMRSGGVEVQGDLEKLKDHHPHIDEVKMYWRKAISKLEDICFGSEPLAGRACEIVKSRMYGLFMNGSGRDILPLVKRLIVEEKIDRLEARSQLLFVRSALKFDKKLEAELEHLLETLNPRDFADRFLTVIAKPSPDDYYDRENGISDRTGLDKKIEALAEEFASERTNWNKYADNFFQSHLSEGFSFGKVLGTTLASAEFHFLTDLLINKLKSVPAEKKNTAVLMGLLSTFENKEAVIDIFNRLLEDAELYPLSFTLARINKLPASQLLALVTVARNNRFPSALFSEFSYGWGLKHLDTSITDRFLRSICEIDNEGPYAAFCILSTWIGSNDDATEKFSVFLRELIINHSALILSHTTEHMSLYYYSEMAIKLLSRGNDEDLARKMSKIIIDEANSFEYYYSKSGSFYRILQILDERYFSALWDALSNMFLHVSSYGFAATHLKDLLGSKHDYNNLSEGLLFGGNREKFETILKWCQEHKGTELYWIAQMLPMFKGSRDGDAEWHPYAKKFIDEFGNDVKVLNAISSKLATYGWAGSVVPKLASDIELFKQMLTHPNIVVKDWAKQNLAETENRRKAEQNRDEEDMFW